MKFNVLMLELSADVLHREDALVIDGGERPSITFAHAAKFGALAVNYGVNAPKFVSYWQQSVV